MEPLIPLLSAWRSLGLGTREVIDAIVAPEHRGPSSQLAGILRSWPGRHYWLDRDHTRLVLIRHVGPPRPERWVLQATLLLLTVICTLAAGALLSGTWSLRLGGDWIVSSFRFVEEVERAGWRHLIVGWSFAAPLLGILLVHELGHYVAARRYALDVSPPFFLPVPPTLSPIGTLGAFLRLRTPVLDRRQLLDVGAAGPLAGFVVACAVLVWGYATSDGLPAGIGHQASFVVFAGEPIFLGESLLTQAFRDHFFPTAASVHLSLPAFAGWVGMFVTGLNLLPLSQLDGGHVLYGMLGKRQAIVGFLTILGLVYLGQYSWSWYVWVAFALFVGGGRWTHPSVIAPGRSVPASRRWIGLACVVVFAVTFVPVPFK